MGLHSTLNVPTSSLTFGNQLDREIELKKVVIQYSGRDLSIQSR
jgi:hypothetical protein